MFVKQFFGKIAFITLIAAALVHTAAIPLQHHDLLSAVALAVVLVLTAAVVWRSLPAGIGIAFAEIMMGGHGHLITTDVIGFPVSLRMVIFAAVMGVWAVQFLRRRAIPRVVALRDGPFVLLFLAVALAGMVGFMANEPAHAFDDMNGYATLLYLLPMISITWNQERKRGLLEVLVGSGIWIVLSTLAILFLFTHLPGPSLHGVYQFVRDARIAEVTLLTGPEWFLSLLPASAPWYFRVFEPAQFFVLSLLLVLAAARLMLWRGEAMPWGARAVCALAAAAFVAGWSRSFFVGAFAGVVVVLGSAYYDGAQFLRHRARHIVELVTLTAVGAVVFWATIVFPFPSHPNLADAAFYRESSGDERDLAVTSRWNLLDPMFAAIMESPVLGRGFGTEVTFVSDDPRVRATNPSGEWTTYRFEWGYQDIWLKMGLLGLAAFVAFGVTLTNAFLYTFRTQPSRWLTVGLFAGVAALFATHVFSPYLNHPIGLGSILFALPFFDWQGTAEEMARNDAEHARNHPVKLSAPAITARNR